MKTGVVTSTCLVTEYVRATFKALELSSLKFFQLAVVFTVPARLNFTALKGIDDTSD